MDRAAVRAEVHSPLWQAGLYRPPGRDVLLDPVKLCRGLARVARERGVRDPRGHAGRRASSAWPAASSSTTAGGATVRADQVVVATSAYSGWLRAPAPTFVPVYDYALVSEPLDARRAGVDRLGAAPGHVRLEQPVPLLPADRRRPDPVGRLRRDPLLRQPGRPGARPPAGHVPTSSRRSSSAPSRSSRACASRIAGAARSTRRRGSR